MSSANENYRKSLMKKYQNKSPEEVIKMVTIEIIEGAIKRGKKKNTCLCQQKRRAARVLRYRT